MVLAFAGRRPGIDFPEDNIAAVREQIELLVDRLRPRVGVGSAAAGADLLVADAVLNRGAVIKILLAGNRESFCAGSVADKGEVWVKAFDALIDCDAVAVREIPKGGDADAAYRAVTAGIVQCAENLAGDDEEIALLAILGPADGTVSHTEELAEMAEARRWNVLRIDPTNPGS
jgi:hypothetical protein